MSLELKRSPKMYKNESKYTYCKTKYREKFKSSHVDSDKMTYKYGTKSTMRAMNSAKNCLARVNTPVNGTQKKAQHLKVFIKFRKNSKSPHENSDKVYNMNARLNLK